MVFGQLTYRACVSDIMICLKTNAAKTCHLGIGGEVSLSTITRATENRSYLIYEDLAKLLIKKAKQLYIEDNGLEVSLKNDVFVIDATTIAHGGNSY